MEKIFLIGSEDVKHAGAAMSSAAESMMRAASIVSESMHRVLMSLEQSRETANSWIKEFREIMEADQRDDETVPAFIQGIFLDIEQLLEEKTGWGRNELLARIGEIFVDAGKRWKDKGGDECV